jgi:hypothetical protein
MVRHPMTETIDSTKAAASTLFLGHNGEWWDLSLVIAGIFVALAAIAAVLATAGSIIAHKREASASEEALNRKRSFRRTLTPAYGRLAA